MYIGVHPYYMKEKMEKATDLRTLFIRYRDDLATPAEKTLFLELIRNGKERALVEELIAESLAAADWDGSVGDEAVLQALEEVLAGIQQMMEPSEAAAPAEAVSKTRTLYRVIGRVAAAVLLLVSGYWGWQRYGGRPDMFTMEVPYGETRTFLLPDSSEVWLNAGSTLRYPAKFSGTQRQVTLENGQAFFDIRPNPEHPFVVAAGELDITVLGTSFEVKAFNNEHEARVTVATGKVGVAVAGNGAQSPSLETLQPLQQLVYSRQQGVTTTKQVPETAIAAWRSNRLGYQEERLDDILRGLERKYNTPIKLVNTELAAERITMQLENEPLADVLDVLSFTIHFTYSHDQDTVVIR